MRRTRILIWRRTRLFVHPIIPGNLTYSCGGRSSSTSGEVDRTNLAFLLGILGGLLMVVLPVASVQVYNGPPCVSTSACPTVPESARGALLVAGLVDIFTGMGAIVTALMLKIRGVRRSAYYGWPLISLAIIHMSSLTASILLSPTNTGVSGFAILYFLGPLLVLVSGWLLVEKKQSV